MSSDRQTFADLTNTLQMLIQENATLKARIDGIDTDKTKGKNTISNLNLSELSRKIQISWIV